MTIVDATLNDRVKTPYLLGAPISLADLLALPPDGNRYARDEKGRLIVSTPDDAVRQRRPAGRLFLRLSSGLDDRFEFELEPPVSFERAYALDGAILPPSHHGPKALVPDLACFAKPIRFVTAPSGHTWFANEGLRLAIELLSPSTWRSDLGDESGGDDVDRWRTYLENGISEYWILNAGFERCGLPPRSGLFLSFHRGQGTWTELDVEGATWAPDDYRGRRPVTGGVVRSLAVPGVSLDLGAFWRECAPDR